MCKRLLAWFRSCPLWSPPPQYGGVVLKVTPSKFHLDTKHSFPGSLLSYGNDDPRMTGTLIAEWDEYNPEWERESKFRIIIFLPDE